MPEILPPPEKPATSTEDRIIPPKDDPGVAGVVEGLFEDSWKSKSLYNTLYARCAYFYEGNQWLRPTGDGRWVPNTMVPRGVKPVQKNRVGQSVDQAVSILAATQPSFLCPPASTDPEDRNRADIATAAVDKLSFMLDTPRYDRILKLWKGIAGTACLESEWQSEDGKWEVQTVTGEDGAPVPLTMGPDGPVPLTDPETQQPLMKPQGAIARRVYTFYETFPDPAASGIDDAAWVIFAYMVSDKDAMRRFNLSKQEIERIKGGKESSKVWSLLKRVFAGAQVSNTQANANGLVVLKLHQAPCAEAPTGRCITVVGGKTIYDDVSQTKGEFRFPFRVFYHGDHGKRFWGIGMVERVLDLQEELNRTLTRYSTTTHKMGNPKVLIPGDCGIPQNGWTDAPAQVVRYNVGQDGAKPEYMAGISMPSDVVRYIDWLDTAFDRVIGINEASSGVLPSSDTSGKAIRALQDKDVQRLALVARADAEEWAKVLRYELFLFGNYWPEGTKISLIGRDLQPFMLDFDRSMFSTPVDIQVEAGEGLPRDPAERQDFLNRMFAPGGPMQTLPPSLRRQYLSLSKNAAVRAYLSQENLYEINTRVQIEGCRRGERQTVIYNDDHDTARRLISQFQVSEDFRQADDSVKALIVDLDRQHATYQMQPKDGQGITLPPGVPLPGATTPPVPGGPAPGAAPPSLQTAHEAAGMPPPAPTQGSAPKPPGAA